MPPARVLVSSCLLGAEVRYHGGSAQSDSPILQRWVAEGRVVSACPEVAGGLSVPRPPAEIVGGDGSQVLIGPAKVVTREGADVTGAFRAGAEHAVEMARGLGIRVAVLKSRSPSCASTQIYDGSFTGHLSGGHGVTAAALIQAGVRVFDEMHFEEADALLRTLDNESLIPHR
jgi:uncharacterized protein YbbK (DUF523 family)